MGRTCHFGQMQQDNYRSCTGPHSSLRTLQTRKRAGFHLLFQQYASRWSALLLKLGTTTFYTASISAKNLVLLQFCISVANLRYV